VDATVVAIAVADAPMAAVDAPTAAAVALIAADVPVVVLVSNAAPAAQGLTVVTREAGLVRPVARSSSPKC